MARQPRDRERGDPLPTAWTRYRLLDLEWAETQGMGRSQMRQDPRKQGVVSVLKQPDEREDGSHGRGVRGDRPATPCLGHPC